MAETMKIQAVLPDSAEDALNRIGRESTEKMMALARAVISGLYMLVRSAKMYDADNKVFEKPIITLADTMNQIIKREGKLDLVGVKKSFHLNGVIVRVDMSSLDNVKFLLEEMHAKDVGGFTVLRSVTAQELRNFVAIFTQEQKDMADEHGVQGKRLMSMKLAKWSKLKDKLENEKEELEAHIDRKKYALTVYGRGVFFTRKYVESLRKGQPINTARCLRIIQDFVDISYDVRNHFLGLTTTRMDQEYLSYHQVNTAMSSIVLGSELGLTKPQLRDLGYIALFHDAGMGVVPVDLANKRTALTPAERAQVQKAPLITVRNILREKAITRATLLRVVTTFEHKTDFGTAVRDSQGNIQMIIPRSTLGLYAKIIAVCSTYDALTSRRPFREAYGPEVSLMLMWTEMRHKFDPDLLKVFMRVMAIQPIKVLSKRQQNLMVGAL